MGHRKWQSSIDRAIQQAIKDGQIDHLPGAGKPLNLNDDPNVPDDMRMAYKIMATNDVAPEWIMLGKTLEKKEKLLLTAITNAVATYHRALGHPALKDNAEKQWQASKRALEAKADAYNNEILSYNLKVPRAIPQRPLFDLEQAIRKAQ